MRRPGAGPHRNRRRPVPPKRRTGSSEPHAARPEGERQEDRDGAQQTRKLGAATPLIAAEWAGTTHLIQQGGKAVEGLRIVQNVNRDDESARYKTFISTYRDRFSREPEYVSILAYDMAVAALQAHVRRSKGMTLKQSLLANGPFEGLQQPIRFNATGDNERAAYFMVVRDGRYVRE